jgi:hypothetical protein
VLAPQPGQLVDLGFVEQGANLVEREPRGPVHQHYVQPFDVRIGVAPVAGPRAHAGYHHADMVVVVQCAHRNAGQLGDGSDGPRVHAAHYPA